MIGEHVQELLPAYSLDALEDEELLQVESHLEQCPECAAALVSYQDVTARLASLVQPASPPGFLKRLLMGAASAFEADQPPRRLGATFSHATLWRVGAVAALLLVAVLSGMVWTALRLNSLEGQNQRMEKALVQQRALAYLVAYPDTTTFLLESDEEEAPSWGMLIGNPEREWGMLVAMSMPDLQPGQVYQLWLVSGDQRFDAGTFVVDDTGYGQLSVRLEEALLAFDALGVTVEPEGGSGEPSGEPVLLGSLGGGR